MHIISFFVDTGSSQKELPSWSLDANKSATAVTMIIRISSEAFSSAESSSYAEDVIESREDAKQDITDIWQGELLLPHRERGWKAIAQHSH